jgi:hypothetical protein
MRRLAAQLLDGVLLIMQLCHHGPLSKYKKREPEVLHRTLNKSPPSQSFSLMSHPLVFYDILVDPTGQDRQCWSANTWKTRSVSWHCLPFSVLTVAACTSLALNYKKVPYTTVWVQYGDIQMAMKEIGATPTDKRPTGEDRYTLPTIRNPATGEVISDSAKIIAYLEEKYPERPLIPQGTFEQQIAFSATGIFAVGPVSRCLGPTLHMPDPTACRTTLRTWSGPAWRG